MIDIIKNALDKGAVLIPSISGGKDSQAMVKTLHNYGFKIHSLLHCDLGRIEWQESILICQRQADELAVTLAIRTRKDGLGLIEYWQRRMQKLKGQNKPFWSSAKHRYCTSDLKRLVANQYFVSLPDNFIISCEGIRAQESSARSKKNPLTIRAGVTSSYYAGMTVEQAINNYRPDKRLVLTWYPIFNFSVAEVWHTYGMSNDLLLEARLHYNNTGKLIHWWLFHPAYVYGNDRVSCKFCILGSLNDLQIGAAHDELNILPELIAMEQESGYTFKNNFSLLQLINPAEK